jgi:VIT1/CCC1 family predicted Fe2+/Mn2+ transporter
MSNETPPDMHEGETARAEAKRHIAAHSLGEAARIGRLSRIREFVLGAQDGLLYVSEIAAEGREIDEFPERETAELAVVLEREGLPREQAETVARGLASNHNVFLRTKVEKELALSPDAGGAALGDAFVVGATYLGAAIVPLWPYFFFFPLSLALGVSLACTLVALFSVGAAKGRVTRLSLLRSGLQVMIVGSVSAGVGFAIGHLVTTLSG